MPGRIIAVLAALTCAALAPPAHALELGVQDAQAGPEQVNAWAAQTHASWERIIVYPGQPGVAEHIRASHEAGRHVILTVGGLGTHTGPISFASALRFIATLPRAERYTIDNEPDLFGPTACSYRRQWMNARRTLGHRLLWGDFSPHRPFTFTLAATKCGPLPEHLDFALHPYQATDPLAPAVNTEWEGGIGNLGRGAQQLRRAGIRVSWWLDEFGYGQNWAGQQTSDERAAWMWPRALARARRVHARVLVIYTAQGSSWDTRPGEQAWGAIRSSL